MKIISIGSDHTGLIYKSEIKDHLENKGYIIKDLGSFSEESVDYPDFIHPTVKKVINQKADIAIIICGSGNGAAMTANKYKEIRAALSWNVETAELARLHNNANVLAIPARFISLEETIKIVDVFINTEFEGGRHQRRIDKMACQ